MLRKPRKYQRLLDTALLWETVVVANRPAITENLLGKNTYEEMRLCNYPDMKSKSTYRLLSPIAAPERRSSQSFRTQRVLEQKSGAECLPEASRGSQRPISHRQE